MMFDLDPAASFDDVPETTLAQVKAELRQVENEIAREHGVDGRMAIIVAVRSGRLAEDELISRWNGLFAAFMDWCKDTPKDSAKVTLTQEGREERPFCYQLLC